MFTLQEIKDAHSKVKSGADFPKYVHDLKKMEMSHYDFFVADGHAKYVHNNGEFIESPAIYEDKAISSTSDATLLKHIIKIHQNGETDFMTFCQQSADAGVVLWRTDVTNMKVIYLNDKNEEMVVEVVPS